MEQETKYNRSGIIKARVFALVVLMLSCSLAITSYKSLSRQFDGIVMHKEIRAGFIQKRYNLFIDQNYKAGGKIELSNKDAIKILTENIDDLLMVGVSYFAYQDAQPVMSIKKDKGSPIIKINETNYIDQGLFWAFISLFGIIVSYVIYKQTTVNIPDSDTNRTEDLDI